MYCKHKYIKQTICYQIAYVNHRYIILIILNQSVVKPVPPKCLNKCFENYTLDCFHLMSIYLLHKIIHQQQQNEIGALIECRLYGSICIYNSTNRISS